MHSDARFAVGVGVEALLGAPVGDQVCPRYVGLALGAAVGAVGLAVGASDGAALGARVGVALGAAEGVAVGAALGTALGAALGAALGTAVVGLAVGRAVGLAVGRAVGLTVGASDGAALGALVGAALGDALGPAVGLALGLAEGLAEGASVGLRVGAAVAHWPFDSEPSPPRLTLQLRERQSQSFVHVLNSPPFPEHFAAAIETASFCPFEQCTPTCKQPNKTRASPSSDLRGARVLCTSMRAPVQDPHVFCRCSPTRARALLSLASVRPVGG